MRIPVEVVCTSALAAGMELTGLPVTATDGEAEVIRELEKRIREGRRSVILADEASHRGLSAEARRALSRQTLPMVVPFPLPEWKARGPREAYIVELLRQAIGYRVRLR
ncbi:MAG TPA: hypothetical protein VKA53_02405 [Thermoanaerobaculia bacterium]|nr:hypothetical protein [Thermoanaerobaculia bacterium]